MYIRQHQLLRKGIIMEEVKMSFRFEEEYKRLLEEIAKLDRRTMTDEIKLLIDRRALELGLSPVYPLARQVETVSVR